MYSSYYTNRQRSIYSTNKSMTLHDMRNYCEKHNIPLISQYTETFLWDFIKTNKPQYICEIGTAAGYSSIFMSQKIQQRWGCMITCEVSYPQYKRALFYHQQQQVKNCICYFLSGTAVDQKIITQPIDMAFIDGEKGLYHEFVDQILPYMAQNWIIICDDVVKFSHKMTSLYTYLEKKQWKVEIKHLDDDDGIMIIYPQTWQ